MKSLHASTKEARRVVVCAAIRNSKGDIICSPRHWDALMREQVVKADADWSRAEQGFVDQYGAFMDRAEARMVAWSANQVVRRCGGDEAELFSENLY